MLYFPRSVCKKELTFIHSLAQILSQGLIFNLIALHVKITPNVKEQTAAVGPGEEKTSDAKSPTVQSGENQSDDIGKRNFDCHLL